MHTSTLKTTSILAAALTLAIFATHTSAQTTTSSAASTSSSSFNWDSLISAADTATTSFDLYTTDGVLGPGELDTSSRFGLYTTATPIVGPIGNGTVVNGTSSSNSTVTGGVAGSTGTTGGGGAGGANASASTSGGSESSGASGSGGASTSAPQATDNVAPSAGGLWVEGAGVLVGLGVMMAAL